MKTTLIILMTLVLGYLDCQSETPDNDESTEVPKLLDEEQPPHRFVGEGEASFIDYETKNRAILDELSHNPSLDLKVLEARLKDKSLRWELKLLYAALLANRGNEVGQKFLVDQYAVTEVKRLPNLFRAIYLAWAEPPRYAIDSRARKAPDIKWAEAVMLNALADMRQRVFKIDSFGEYSEPVRTMAISHGRFHEIFTSQRSPKAVPLLCEIVSADMRNARDDEMFSENMFLDYGGSSVLFRLKDWDDPRIEGIMLEYVEAAVRKWEGGNLLDDALEWLIKKRSKTVAEVAKNGLGLESVLAAFARCKHAPYLTVIRDHLPNLQDGDLVGLPLNRQHEARAHAEIILIMGESEDPVRDLMAFIEDAKNQKRHMAVYYFEEFKDPRVVPWALERAQVETEWYVAFNLVDLLGEIDGPEATEALTTLLDCKFNNVDFEGDSSFDASDYQARVRELLARRAKVKTDATPD